MKALLITYFFPPSSSVAAYRTGSFAKYLPLNGVECVVVTRHWNSNYTSLWEKDTNEMCTTTWNKARVYSLPFWPAKKSSVSPRLRQMWEIFSGALLGTAHDQIPKCFFGPALNIIQQEKPDVLITSSGPMGCLELTHKLHQVTQIPYVADLRDTWSNAEFRRGYVSPLTKLSNRVYRSLFRKWLSSAAMITAVNKEILEAVAHPLGVETVVLPNGYDEELMDQVSSETADVFTLCCTGTIYPEQDILSLSRAIQMFLMKAGRPTIRLKFIGAREIPEVADRLQALLPGIDLQISRRVPQHDAIVEMKSAHLLFYPAWQGYRGITTTKIYEYLASGKPILLIPTDNDVMQELVTRFNAGLCTSDPEIASEFLRRSWLTWKSGGTADLPRKSEIKSFSRKVVAENLANLIKNRIGSR